MLKFFLGHRRLLLSLFVLGAPSAFGSLTFTPIFDATIGGNAAMVTTINNTLALYSGLFSTNINVTILFQNVNTGLGGSQTSFYVPTFGGGVGGVCAALASSAKSADDATSVAATGSCAGNNPVTNGATIAVSSANGRALGFITPGSVTMGGHSGLDSAISLNTSIMNISRQGATNPNFYDMQSVIEHEVDEVLGTVSGADNEFGGTPTLADLFRYSAPGTRMFAVPGTAYLSVNGGITNLASYNNVTNCNGSAGDCGDFDSALIRVQNAFGTPGAMPDVTLGSPEERLLDVVGYTLAAPEPATLSLFALSFGLLAGAKKLRGKVG